MTSAGTAWRSTSGLRCTGSFDSWRNGTPRALEPPPLLQRRAHECCLGRRADAYARAELARLVWELRRELEPLGATVVVVNERRRGYRLITCAEAASSTSARHGADVPLGHPQVRPAETQSSSAMDPRRIGALAVVAAVPGAVTLVRDSGEDRRPKAPRMPTPGRLFYPYHRERARAISRGATRNPARH